MKRSKKSEKKVQQAEAEAESVAAQAEMAAETFKAPVEEPLAINQPKQLGVGPMIPAMSGPSTGQGIEPLTPLTLAQSLKIYLDDANFVATGVAHGYINMTAYDVGKLLFDASLYPTIPSVQMQAALLSAGFSQAQVDEAIAQLYSTSVQFTVQANIAWQSTGVTIQAGANMTVTYVTGMWTANPATGTVNSAGNPEYKAREYYTYPGANEGALIGRVNDNLFVIGLEASVPAEYTGLLEFCINDDLDGHYGPGLTDNYGTVTMEIKSVQAGG